MTGVPSAPQEKQREYLVLQIEVLKKWVGERPISFRSPIGGWAGEHVPKFLIETGFV